MGNSISHVTRIDHFVKAFKALWFDFAEIKMQDPNEDTEWNDILRAKGILPPKEKKVPTYYIYIQLRYHG